MSSSFLFFLFFFIFLYFLNNDQWQILRRIKLIIKKYFLEQDSPFNIAIFRIIFFSFILISFNGYFGIKKILWFSHLPADLRFPPVGMNYLLSVVPITPDLVLNMMAVFLVSCFLALIGCFARIASFLAAISGIYVLGIPEFYGKVGHYNHLIWFMLILSVSKCSDVLSVDSLWKAWREADQGRIPRNQDSVEYALPLRFIWLLIGEIYFFPGFFKVILSKGAWAFSDNLKYQLYDQWFEHGGWLPFFRLDQHPMLYKMCGLGVILFELSFVILILFPVLRYIAVIGGILFDQMTNLFMKIDFFDLQICYLAFINWAGIFARIGKWMLKEPWLLSFEGMPRSHQRRVAVLVKFDIFQRIVLVDQSKPLIKPQIDVRLLKFTGFSLLLINAIFGFSGITSGWPFTCYPTFARVISEARIDTITPYGVLGDKEEIIGLNTLKQRMDLAKFTGMTESILSLTDQDQKEIKLKALVSVMKSEGFDFRKYSKIRFYKTVYSTQPEKAQDPPVAKELLAEVGV
jgi:hypothetical protein